MIILIINFLIIFLYSIHYKMSGFFVADNKIPLKESYVAIPSENGLSYGAQKLIEFYIPPNIDAFKPKNSYLQFDLELSQDSSVGANTRLQLDELIGGQILLDTVRIHSGDKTQLLEEIRHYPVHVATKYAYMSNPTLKNLRAINEGAGIYTPDCRGTEGSTKSILANHKFSPYYKSVKGATSESFTNTNAYGKCKLKLPLHTGLFQNDRVVPVGLMNGLFVTILTSENKRVFRQLDSVSYNRRLPLNPKFHSVDNNTGLPASWPTAISGSTNKFYIDPLVNNQFEVANFPFVVGETFAMALEDGTENTFTPVAKIASLAEVGAGVNKRIEVTLTASCNPATQITNAGGSAMFSTSVSAHPAYAPSYEISNAELVLNKIDMGAQARAEAQADMREGKMMVYDFLTTQVYNYSQLKGDRVANIGIPANHQRAKSIICVPTDASVRSTTAAIVCTGTYEIHGAPDRKLLSSQSGIAGIADELTEYFFFYDGRNQPSLNVNTTKVSSRTSIDAIHLLELDKALSQADMPALQMSRFNENFCIGRALSLNNGVYDMRGKDCRLNVLYQNSAAAGAPLFDKLWCNFVYHIRRINIRADSISVEV
jgi:hypothetical protein